MMGGGGLLLGPKPAYLMFTGEMLEAFMILTNAMYKKGGDQLLTHGKFSQTFKEGADELKSTPSFEATEYAITLVNKLKDDLSTTAKPDTPSNLEPYMSEIVDICSKFLAQNAEFNKDKGPAFKLLVKTMKGKSTAPLYQKGKAKRAYGDGAKELNDARGLESDHDDPNLSQELHSKLSQTVESVTPADLKADMAETLDLCSKYLSQCAVDEIERGPAFDLLVKTLEHNGGEPFTPEFPALAIKYVAGYSLKSAPGMSSVVPDPATAPKFIAALHSAVDSSTPEELSNDMNEVVDRCGNYLSAYVRDRDKMMQILLKTMKSNHGKELEKREDYAMNYGTGAMETETAPFVVPYHPIKDIADVAKGRLATDVESATPPDGKVVMKGVVRDVGKHLSQPVSLRSGVAGHRYPLELLSSVMASVGKKPLFKFKAFGQTYKDAAHTLRFAGPLESDPASDHLHHEILGQMKEGVNSRLPPTVAQDLHPIMTDAAKHLAKHGMEKGKALEHLVNLMKEKGEEPLGNLQGYDQSYNDGARRIELSPSLANDKVDKSAYDNVRTKLKTLVDEKPAPEHAKHMPELVEDSSKYLASPMPETNDEKRRVLADLMGRKKDDLIGQEDVYKMTFREGGEEIMQAPVGVTTAHDEKKNQAMRDRIRTVIPDKKMEAVLQAPTEEGAAHITDILKGRGEAMHVIHEGLKKQEKEDFMHVGKFNKTHGQAAEMVQTAKHFDVQEQPHEKLMEMGKAKIDAVDKSQASEVAKKHMPRTSVIASKYIASVAAKESGLSPDDLNNMGKAGTSGESDEDRRKREEEERRRREEEERRRREEEEKRKREEEERRRREQEGKSGSQASHTALAKPHAATGLTDADRQRDQALQLLHTQLKAKGPETFYKQPHTDLKHGQASDWISMKPPMKVESTVMNSGDTARLHKKFERKLSTLVSKVTPPAMVDVMQDCVIESSRILSEYFVSQNYKALVREALISEMQRRGNELLVELDGAAESYFFAAQRLKKAKSLEVEQPCNQVSFYLRKKLEEMIRCRSMARKLSATMKDHIKDASEYLSNLVTKPDEQIEAYVFLLDNMEATGDTLLIDGDINKSYKDCAAYLRQLTSFEDRIGRPNSGLQSTTEGRLKNIVPNASGVMTGVISESTKLLVSYIMLQGEKTEALKVIIETMKEVPDNVILRHGPALKTFADGVTLLSGKNTDQLRVTNADPVVARKIQLKLANLMHGCTPEKFQPLMDDVIEDATMYLAVHLLASQTIKICKCMNSQFVQCELWCDEILRHVTRGCCKCARHSSAQTIAEPSGQQSQSPGTSRANAPVEITIKQCPTPSTKDSKCSCPANRQIYSMYSTTQSVEQPKSTTGTSYSFHTAQHKSPVSSFSTLKTSVETKQSTYVQTCDRTTSSSGQTDRSTSTETSTTESQSQSKTPFWREHTAMFAQVYSFPESTQGANSSHSSQSRSSRGRRTPISTDQMADWHAMMTSLMWNVQAWRSWIQENLDRGMNVCDDVTREFTEDDWNTFRRRVLTEAMQWRQYNMFSQNLSKRLALRYRDKQIVSPTRASEKTCEYTTCQREMLDVIDMFHRWTQWLAVVVKEADAVQAPPDCQKPMHELRWKHYCRKVQECAEDWKKYIEHLKMDWERKYSGLISGGCTVDGSVGGGRGVWVVSACGAVPSGAVAAGRAGTELVWLARVPHHRVVLPAALRPCMRAALLYAAGSTHHYSKYQVMCNADVTWVSWRSGGVCPRAVRVSPDVTVGRVLYRGDHLIGAVLPPHYRCHVVIFERPFAFNCYELLVYNTTEDTI